MQVIAKLLKRCPFTEQAMLGMIGEGPEADAVEALQEATSSKFVLQ